jgi:hypothetical protein
MVCIFSTSGYICQCEGLLAIEVSEAEVQESLVRKPERDRADLNARGFAKCRESAFEQTTHVRGVPIPGVLQEDRRRDDAVGIESGVEVSEVGERAHQEPGPDEEDGADNRTEYRASRTTV